MNSRRPPVSVENKTPGMGGMLANSSSSSDNENFKWSPAGKSWASECGKGQHIDITDKYMLRHYPPTPPGNSPLEIYKTGRLLKASHNTFIFQATDGDEEHFQVTNGRLYQIALRAQGVTASNKTITPSPLKDCGAPVTVNRQMLKESTPIGITEMLVHAVTFGDDRAASELLRKGADPRFKLGNMTLPALARSAKVASDARSSVLTALAAYGVEERPRALTPDEWKGAKMMSTIPAPMHGKWSAICELSNQFDNYIEVSPTVFFNAPVESIREKDGRYLIITRYRDDFRGAIAHQVQTDGVRIAVTSQVSEYLIEGIEPTMSSSNPLVIKRCRY